MAVDNTKDQAGRVVPESVLKKKKVALLSRRAAQFKKIQKAKFALAKKKAYFVRAERYLLQQLKSDQEKERLKAVAKEQGNYYVPPQAKLGLVIRTKGIWNIPPKPRKVLQLLRLRQINNAVFVKLNKSMLNMLRIAEPYIAWGYPNLETIRNLVYKRGFLRVNNNRTPITDNLLVERKLGKYDIICVEDLINQIHTVGPYFKQVNNFLWHFKLNNPVRGWRKKSTHFVEGGDYGNREHLINELVSRMV